MLLFFLFCVHLSHIVNKISHKTRYNHIVNTVEKSPDLVNSNIKLARGQSGVTNQQLIKYKNNPTSQHLSLANKLFNILNKLVLIILMQYEIFLSLICGFFGDINKMKMQHKEKHLNRMCKTWVYIYRFTTSSIISHCLEIKFTV